MQSRVGSCLLALTLIPVLPATTHAQGRLPQGRLTATAWAGTFTTMGGFSDGEDFFQFDDGSSTFGAAAFGGGLHYGFDGGLAVGIEGLFTSTDYTRFDRDEGTLLGTGSSSAYGLLANARMTGTPGAFTFVADGGVGFFSWNLDDLESRNTDLALEVGIGAEYRPAPRLSLFGQYTWWWVYHEKDENVVTNTARHNILRGGLRFILF